MNETGSQTDSDIHGGGLGNRRVIFVQTVKQQREWSQQSYEESAVDLVNALKPTIEQAYRDGWYGTDSTGN